MQPLVLDTTSKSITAVMSGAAATTNPDFTAHYSDHTTTAFTEGSNDGTLNGTTPVTLVAAPSASTQRVIKEIIISNTDTASVTLSVYLKDGVSSRRIFYGTIVTNGTFTLNGVFDATGAFLTTSSGSFVTSVTASSPLASSGGTTPNITLNSAVGLSKGGTNADLSAAGPGHLAQVTSGATVTTIKDNFAGTTAPTTSNDGTQGYSVGSYWYDTTNNKAYVCLANTTSAAVWRLISDILTTKGDLLSYSTVPARLAVGSDNQVLFADSAQTTGNKWAYPATTTLFANTVLGGSSASIDLTPISGNYSHLRLLVELRSDRSGSTSDDAYVRFNADSTASHYYTEGVVINSTTPTLTAQQRLGATATGIDVFVGATGATATADYLATWYMDIYNYKATDRPRNVYFYGYVQRTNSSGDVVIITGGGKWTNAVDAITEITLVPAAGSNWVAKSSYMLLGIV